MKSTGRSCVTVALLVAFAGACSSDNASRDPSKAVAAGEPSASGGLASSGGGDVPAGSASAGQSHGGELAASGGVPAGSSSGGASAVAGSDPTHGAGASSGGSAGSTAGGQASSGGSVGATRSAGCGKAPPPASTTRQTLDVAGTMRQYIVVYPSGYDSNRPYRVLFEFHGSTGTAEENIRFKWYGVEPLSGGSVIFVAPQGLGDPSGWPNTGGQDVAFTKQLVTLINDTFCVDTSRIFVTGFSYGAMFSNTLGCQMGDVFRAIAPASGAGPNGKCVGEPAALVIHGAADTTIDVSSGEASRDHWLAANHCGATTSAMEPAPCVKYEGCDPGAPVGWCEHTGGHQIVTSLFGPAIWNFISQF
jgi:poly(3-hydroxybutyrate) depolymerase